MLEALQRATAAGHPLVVQDAHLLDQAHLLQAAQQAAQGAKGLRLLVPSSCPTQLSPALLHQASLACVEPPQVGWPSCWSGTASQHNATA